jgi:hypothetical protein
VMASQGGDQAASGQLPLAGIGLLRRAHG